MSRLERAGGALPGEALPGGAPGHGVASRADPEEALRQVEAGVKAEVDLKRREANWLLDTAKALSPPGAPDPVVSNGRAMVKDSWDHVQKLTQSQTDKLQKVIEVSGKKPCCFL